MAFSFLARFRIRADAEQRFIALARQMEALAPDEPGTLAYRFFRLAEPGMFAVYERFADAAADAAHIAYPHNAPLIAEMIGCMDGGYVREMLLDLESAATQTAAGE